jgi:eukaryotic-like serine/threonine-protein kinase
MTASSADLTNTALNHYVIESLVGRGGMGEVYRARDTVLGRAVALKVLPADLVEDPDRLARFVQEARAASALNHPHLVSIYEIGSATPRRDDLAAPRPVHYIAMELVTGDTLRTLIDQRRLDVRRTLDVFTQIADALAAAHAAGIIHRDLKPENVMVAAGGYAKVLDFGLAKLRQDMSLSTQQTTIAGNSAPGLLLGTVGYMSPEQAEGRPIDHRSDIFSFGCVLYEAATGVRAFSGSAISALHAIVNTEPTAMTMHVPATPSELQRIVRKCLAKNPDERYQAMREVAIDLRDLRRQLDSTSSGVVAAPSAQSRTRVLPLALAAALVAAAVVIGWLAWPQRALVNAPARVERIEGIEASIDAAISPDGRYVAYVESRGGQQRLMLRQLDTTRAIELVPRAPVGFWGLAFTPDGGTIFYAIKGKSNVSGTLLRIPLLGGDPVRVLDGIDSTVTFAPDGRQLAYLRADHPQAGASALMIASADGTNVRPLATRQPPEFLAPGFFIAPSWSPDGRTIVTSIRSAMTRDAGLVAFDVANGSARAFGDRFVETSFTRWMSDGSGVLFVARHGGVSRSVGGQLFFQPWPDGAARAVTSDVIDYRNVTVSSDGRSLVTVGTDSSASIWTIPLAGGDAQRIPSTRVDGRLGIAWLGARIVFTTFVRRAAQIWVMDRDGANRRALSSEGENAWPRPSHDGSFIAFFGSRGDQAGIWRMDVDGGNARKLADVTDASYLDITPDDRWVTFSSLMDGTPSTWRVASGGGTPERLIPYLERASISPDGTRFVGVYRPPGGSIGLATMPLTGGALEWVPTAEPMASTQGIMEWTRDGRGILFSTAERSNLNLFRFEAGSSARLTRFSEDALLRGDLSPDGTHLLVTRVSGGSESFLITNFRD